MATTESSAIARLVDAAQNRGLPGPDSIFEPVDHQAAPTQYSGLPPGKASGGKPWWLLLVAVVVIGGSVAGGYVLAQQQGDPEVEAIGTALANGGTSAATADSIVPDEVAAAAVMPPIPTATAEADAADAEDVEEELEPELDEKELQLAARTGFDILVEPKGAKITLDGHSIGAAPLRVRNLLPGPHQIAIEGPEGYFGQHREFALEPGEAMVLRLALDPLGAEDQPAADAPETAAPEEATAGEAIAASEASPENAQSRREQRTAAREARRKKSAIALPKSEAPNASEEKDLASGEKVSLGTLMLGAKPPCEIMINGKSTGLTTPQRSIQLPEGTHRVVLVNDEHGIRKSFKVRIKSGRTTRAIQDLTKKL
tara:strand:- start:93748 stop:94860 length:1113 start_codon:yes stop_codon:yes gene_type:complete